MVRTDIVTHELAAAQAASTSGLADLDRFAREVARWLASRAPEDAG